VNSVTWEAVETARAAAVAAEDTAEEWAAIHADSRCHLAALLVAFDMPDAASLVFKRDEDTIAAETSITLVNIRDSDGVLLWYDTGTGFNEHPDARALGEPPELEPDTLSDIEYQIETAYDAHAGHFDTTSDGADVMTGANLLVLPVPFQPGTEPSQAGVQFTPGPWPTTEDAPPLPPEMRGR
jgi:hypothetical protein